jgi:hypothetical protein
MAHTTNYTQASGLNFCLSRIKINEGISGKGDKRKNILEVLINSCFVFCIHIPNFDPDLAAV